MTTPVQSGRVLPVPAGDAASLQSAINHAACGDTLVLPAGSVYNGSFSVPNKSCKGWIVIQSAGAALLPSGTRVVPSQAGKMATLRSDVVGRNTLQFLSGAHHWRLIGLEIATSTGMTQNALLETDGPLPLPNHIIIDRCYVHGDASAEVRRGVSLQVSFGAVIDSDIRDIHKRGVDSQAIGIWAGAGPYLIRNNFLSAASENIVIGGADPPTPGLVPSDVTIVGNHFWKDYSAWRGANWNVKNLLEFKNAQRVLVRGNVLEYSWSDGQIGMAVLLTPRNQDGGCPWCVVQDVTMEYNLIRHAGGGIEMANSDDGHRSLPTQRIRVSNNLLTDISTSYGGHGWAFESLAVRDSAAMTAEHDITIDHNTAIADGALLYLGDSGVIRNYQFTNNLGNYGRSGIFGGGKAPGSQALHAFVPDAACANNGLLTPSGAPASGTWPSGILWHSEEQANFVDYRHSDYRLLGASPYHAAGTDGKDIGVWDWKTLYTETRSALSGRAANLR